MYRKISFVVPFLIFFLVVPTSAPGAGKGKVKYLTSITRGGETGHLGLLGGLFFDENRKRLYVADTTSKWILAFDVDFNFLSQFNAGGALEAPTSLVRNSKGQFFVAQPTKGSVLFVDIKHKAVNPVDFSAVPEADLIYPGNMSLDSADNLYIVDKAKLRILIFDADRRFNRQVLIKEGWSLGDVKVGSNGNIYALDTIGGAVRVFDSEGNPLLTFGNKGKDTRYFDFPVSLAVDRKGLIYVVDQHKHKILIFNKKGEFLLEFSELGWREGRLHYPSYIYVNKAGTIFVVDRGNSRISIFE